MSDNNWIKPPNTLVRKGPDNTPHKFSYWVDKKGHYHLYTKDQLAICNILTNLNLILIRALIIMDTLKTMDKKAKVEKLVNQDYAALKVTKSSVFNQFITLMAAAPKVTFGEFLNYISAGGNPQTLIKMGKKAKFDIFYTSDRLK